MSVNVDRMRRYAEQGRAERERAEWLAAMTPEHRARHEDPNYYLGACATCWKNAMSRFTATIDDMVLKVPRP